MDDSTPESYYETYWSDEGYCPRGQTTPFLVQLFRTNIQPGWSCLDVGCGDGRTAGSWLREYGCTYVGVDISENAVQAGQALGHDVRTIAAPEVLPFPEESFDAALCIEVFEHLFQPQLTAAEICRVLRPGGVLIATTPNVAYWRRRLDLLLLGRWNPAGDDCSIAQPWRDPHLRFFTPRSLEAMLRVVGFSTVNVGGHYGSLVRDMPLLGRWWWRGTWGTPSSPLYRALETRFPSLFGGYLDVVARKPASGSSAVGKVEAATRMPSRLS